MEESVSTKINCPACLTVNEDFAVYCVKCNFKLGSGLNPLDIVNSEGELFRKAVTNRPKPIVLFVVWLVFLPVTVIGLGLAFNQAIYDRGSNAFLAFWFGVFIAMLGIYFLYTVTKNYFTMKEKSLED